MTRTVTRTTETVLPAVPPFDFAATLRFLDGFALAADAQEVTGGTLVRAVRAGGRTVLARVTAEGGAAVRCVLHADGPLDPGTAGEANARIAFSLSLADDLTGFYAIGRDDPDFAPVLERLHGYHQAKFPTPLECLVWSILTQRNGLTVTLRAHRALGREIGNTVVLDGTAYTAFPEAEQLAALSPGRIAELVGNQRKGPYLHGAVRGWLDLDEEWLRTAPYAEARKALLGLPGVGEWAAAFILLRGLGRTDETPNERKLLDPAARVYGRELTMAQVQKLGERYGRWAGYWAHYLRAAP
ncbi:DNA-3-methyladenine glycosylase family protein [Actinomadura kijaniata]|uniref:DNA-3-methyladenine glycosylase family protein n=1 Tax=Actinomadura kijaniata TaxID=46161 RepID=UPI000832D40B|nr:DNA-3-methyladenine glycosylase [Actinomadura kijaniata]